MGRVGCSLLRPEKVTLHASPGWGAPLPSYQGEKAGAESVQGGDTMDDRKIHICPQVWGWGWLGSALPGPGWRDWPRLRRKPTWGVPHSPPTSEGVFLSLLVEAWLALKPTPVCRGVVQVQRLDVRYKVVSDLRSDFNGARGAAAWCRMQTSLSQWLPLYSSTASNFIKQILLICLWLLPHKQSLSFLFLPLSLPSPFLLLINTAHRHLKC